ncbi:MAG: GHKL domain-containing protein [Lachnospiraceae bacterium]|nr:GHKL domain-containing protein [Lachnospiraceae bacterium]
MNEIHWIVMELLINFAEVYLYYWFFSKKLHKRFSGIKKWLTMLFFTILTLVLDRLGVDPTVKMCGLFITWVILVVWIYKTTIRISLLLNGLFAFSIIVSESLVFGIMLLIYGETDTSIIMQQPLLRLQIVPFSKLLTFILLVLYLKLSDRKTEKYTLKEVGILLLQAVTSVLCLIMIVEFSFYYKDGFGLGMLFLVILAFVIIISYLISYYLIDGYFSYRTREKEFLLMEMRNEKMLENYKQIEKNQQNVYRLYHDLKKHVHTMLLLENNEEAAQYMEKVFNDTKEIDGEFQTGNRLINAILYDEWKKAVDSGIRVQFAVEPGSFDQIDLADVTVILGNALENAREACIKRIANGKSAYMQLKVLKQEQQLFIMVSNEFDGNLLKKDNVFLSSKKNTHLHGIGMKSIQTAVEKYHGSMKVDVKENKFKLLILLYFRDEDLD